MKPFRIWVCLVDIILLAMWNSVATEFKADQSLYHISWKGPHKYPESSLPKDSLDSLVMITKENEKYHCFLPDVVGLNEDIDSDEIQPSPESLLEDVLRGKTRQCSYRLEPYWTYELCHGKTVKQFHEEKDSEGVVHRAEYILGTLQPKELDNILKPVVKPANSQPGHMGTVVQRRNIDNRDTPYFSVEMGGGTPCDLSNTPRMTTVLYICHPGAGNEIMSISEVRSCEYEVLVLSPALCRNANYRVKDNPVQDISCLAVDGSPSRPSSLASQHPMEGMDEGFVKDLRAQDPVERPSESPPMDEALAKQFLAGDYCLIGGGSGWWKYEFCNGRFVNQFHEEHGKPKDVIHLGFWHEEAHVNWYGEKKRPRSSKQVTHLYTKGDICDLTGQPRSAQVILKCRHGPGQQLSIYLVEPSPCQYVVGVESPILCPLIENADENGLFRK